MITWESFRLGDVSEVAAGQAAPQGATFFGNDGYPFVRAGSLESLVDEGGESSLRKINESVAKLFRLRLLPAGTVIFAKSGMSVNRDLVYRLQQPAYVVSHLAAITPSERVDGQYLTHWLRLNPPSRLVNDLAYPSIRIPDIENLNISLPPVSEQRRIATLLDNATAIRRKRRESLRFLGDILRSAFLEMVGDPITNPNGWDRQSLGAIATVTTGNTPPRANSEFYGDEIEWIKSDNINTTEHYLTRAKERLSGSGRDVARIVGPGAILMTCIAGSRNCIGNVCLSDREVAFNQQINAITPHPPIDHRFLYVQLLVNKRVVQSASTDSMKGMVSKSRLEGVRVMTPPPDLQKRFGEVFTTLHASHCNLTRALAVSDELFNSLAQQALSGQA